MVKLLRLVGLVSVLTVTLPLLSSAPLFACLSNCGDCATWGCRSSGGACVMCCDEGTPGCVPFG
jgi:hypothetical protein